MPNMLSFPSHQDEDEAGDKVDGKLGGRFGKKDLDVSSILQCHVFGHGPMSWSEIRRPSSISVGGHEGGQPLSPWENRRENIWRR